MIEIHLAKRKIYLTPTVIDIFRKFRQVEDLHERGGIVLGQVNRAEDKILVCRASVPGELEKSSRFSFLRDKTRAQSIVEYEFYNSAGKNTYLGEWHTHPSKTATPSHQDMNMIFEQYHRNSIEVTFSLLFIVALSELFIGVHNGKKITSTVIKF